MKLNENVAPREYQVSISGTASEKNTLVVLPTGTGKTLIAILVAVNRIGKYSDSKILMLAPTRPLVNQHAKSFLELTDIDSELVAVLSGKIVPEDRRSVYRKSKIIVATPQTIENDLENNVLRLEDYSLLVVDECHRSVKNYAYPSVAKRFVLQSKHPCILGLTASPGSSKEKIDEICSNLFIDSVEVRSELDEDVSKYVQPIEKENVYVELPEEFSKIKLLLGEALRDDVYWLKEKHYLPMYNPPKKILLDLQRRIVGGFIRGNRNPAMFAAMTKVTGAIKIQYMLELLETQGVDFVQEYLKKLGSSNKRNDRIIMNDPRIRESSETVDRLHSNNVEHPKLYKILEIVKNMIEKKKDSRIICFANYRATVDKINNILGTDGVKSEILIGQAVKEGRGLTQKKQIETIQNFNDGLFNVLVASSIGEEGLSIKDVDTVVFYDAVASEIRRIQRTGRTGRTAPGRVIFMITKGTLDEAYYASSLRKEERMKNILHRMKRKGVVKRKLSLVDWTKKTEE